ncbi:interleukin-18-binding protein [Grus japonensis]|uniref:Interleukin-18-binding protein n=1 Tax=Grus japonensis TaxID=30415 RepID=A0ABC9WYY9_GRUJA
MYLLQHGLIYSHRYFEVHLLQCGLIFGPESLERYTCCGTDITTATDALRCTCSVLDLFMATDASGHPAPAWTHSQVTVPSTRVHTGAPACPVLQHGNRSDALAICQPRRITIAVIKMFPGTAEYDDQQYSSTASSESKKQPLTSTRPYYTVRQASPMASTGACQLLAKQQ